MSQLRISSHGRLQDWIASERGYFDDEGLDYELDVVLMEGTGGTDVRSGAYEAYGTGTQGKRDMSCACHWAVNQAAADQRGTMWGGAYSVLPAGIYVAPESDLRRPADLAGVEVGVGYHSGSHFSALQALEAVLDPDAIDLHFIGQPFDRIDALLARDLPAANVWGATTYLLEQQGFRKVLDSTFMAGFMFSDTIDSRDVERYFNALKRAQMDLDYEPEAFKHHFLKEIPDRFHDLIDVRGFGTGERVVFLEYTAEAYERAQSWMRERNLFDDAGETPAYESVVQV